MAYEGELAYYAASSGLPSGTLADHKLGYYAAQGFATGTLTDREYDFWLSQTGLTRSVASYVDARYQFFKGQLGSGYDIDSMMRDFFAGGGGDVTAPNPGTIAGSAITSSGFTLTISGASDAGGLHATPYAFSTDNGASWSPFQASNVFVASGLSASTGYTVKGRVRDAALNQADTAGVLVTTSAGAFVPTDIAGLTGWWDASDASTFTFGTGSAVAQWRDKSGMARHVDQATGAKQPTRDQTVNGLSAVKFVASNQHILRGTHAATPRPKTVWAIVRPDTANTSTEVFIGHSNMSLRSQNVYGMDATASLYSAQPDTNGVPAFVAGVFRDDTTSTIHVNGTTATGNAGTIGSGTMVFSLGGNNSDAEHASYTICETGVYDGLLTAPQIAQLHAYAQSKWGVDPLPSAFWATDVADYPGSGTTIEDSVGAVDLLFNSSPVYQSASPEYMELRKTISSRLQSANDATLDLTAAQSFEAWVRMVDTGEGALLSRGAVAGSGGWMLWWTSGQVRLYTRLAARVSLTVPTGVWTHIVGVLDGTNAKLYRDGVEAASAAYTGFPASVGSVPILAGGYLSSPNFFGNIDYGAGAVYNKALNAAEVATLFNAKRSRFGL